MAPNDFIRNDLWCVRLTDVCVAGDPAIGESPTAWSKGSRPSYDSPRVMRRSSQRGLGEASRSGG